MATFIITTRTNGEFQFNLHADNDEIILTSEGYTTKAGCEHGIMSVKENASDDDRYELNTSADNQFYFNLKSTNGQVIGTSEMYEDESSRAAGVERVKSSAPDAEIDDQTYVGEEEEDEVASDEDSSDA